MKIVAIVQARTGSIRLPNKVMKPIKGIPMIEILLKRLSNSKILDHIVLATSKDVKTPALNPNVLPGGGSTIQKTNSNTAPVSVPLIDTKKAAD